MQGSQEYSTDYEGYDGRTSYAQNCVGGYYAARLAVTEKLKEINRQAAVLCIRVITPEYTQPLGVWVVREAVRKTISLQPIEFSSRELMTAYCSLRLMKSFAMEAGYILGQSKLLARIKNQAKLSSFL